MCAAPTLRASTSAPRAWPSWIHAHMCKQHNNNTTSSQPSPTPLANMNQLEVSSGTPESNCRDRCLDDIAVVQRVAECGDGECGDAPVSPESNAYSSMAVSETHFVMSDDSPAVDDTMNPQDEPRQIPRNPPHPPHAPIVVNCTQPSSKCDSRGQITLHATDTFLARNFVMGGRRNS